MDRTRGPAAFAATVVALDPAGRDRTQHMHGQRPGRVLASGWTLMVATAIAVTATVVTATPGSSAMEEPTASRTSSVAPLSPSSFTSVGTSNELTILSSEELSSVFAGVAMDGGHATVVAETTIRRDVPRNQLQCGPRGQPHPRGCPIGVVEPSEAGRGFLPVVARKAAMLAFPDDRSSLEGTMGYRIDGDQLELLGPVATPTGPPLVAVEPEAMAAADALPAGTLIAVDGWLGVVALGAECPVGPGGAGGSSPFAICPTGWITTSGDFPTKDPDEIVIVPHSFGIKVQSDAYQAFAPDPQPAGSHATRPRRAAYLLRHVKGGLPDDRVLGWKVIGRIDPIEGAGPPTVTAKERGLLLELWLDQTTVPVGERLTGLARVSNVGTKSPRWETNICQVGPARTAIEVSLPKESGVTWTGKAATFKRKLLAYELRPGLLQDIRMIDIESGCTAWGAIRAFKPGSVSQMVLAWDAIDRPGRPIVPGTATVTSTFETWKPHGKIDTRQPNTELVAETTIEITGELGTSVPVARYIDAALSDDAFRAWVERQRKPRWWEPKASYWPSEAGDYPKGRRHERATVGAVDIGMFGPSPVGEITIDTTTIDVLGRRLVR